MNNNDVVIIDGCRTAVGNMGGTLKSIPAVDLATVCLKGIIERTGVDASQIDDVILGQCRQTSDEPNIARVAALQAGIPVEVPAYTTMRQCASGMTALHNAYMTIKCGYNNLVLAGGVESMTKCFAPYPRELMDDFLYEEHDVDPVGGGSAYIHASKDVEKLVESLEGDEKTGANIILKALEAPVRRIAENAGVEGSVIVNTIKAENPGYGYDALNEAYVNMIEAGILDPAKVTRSALQNATSVASTLLTTESVVADIKEDAPAMPAGGAPGMGMM